MTTCPNNDHNTNKAERQDHHPTTTNQNQAFEPPSQTDEEQIQDHQNLRDRSSSSSPSYSTSLCLTTILVPSTRSSRCPSCDQARTLTPQPISSPTHNTLTDNCAYSVDCMHEMRSPSPCSTSPLSSPWFTLTMGQSSDHDVMITDDERIEKVLTIIDSVINLVEEDDTYNRWY